MAFFYETGNRLKDYLYKTHTQPDKYKEPIPETINDFLLAQTLTLLGYFFIMISSNTVDSPESMKGNYLENFK